MKTSASPWTRVTLDFKDLLNEEYVRRQVRNPRFSIRSFAKMLKTDFSTLHKLMIGKRVIGKKLILELGERLNLPVEKLQPYVHAHQLRAATKKSIPSSMNGPEVKVLTSIHSDLIVDFNAYAIHGMVCARGS